ncbi:MAG: AAA family ATPase [Candidatus Lokiarchaeota archaeon]|nr:AAA family ATPase [Candidatus Lokiarchaeota archaeon]
MIIGLVGKIGAGKDSIAEILMKKYDFDKQIRFSDPLTELLSAMDMELNRNNYQKLGFNLRDVFGKNIIINTIIDRIKSMKNKNIVVNGIRYRREFDAIKSLGGIIIGITIDNEIRFNRINKRKRFGKIITWEEFKRYDNAETEVEIDDLLKITDFKIHNNYNRENLEKNIDNLMNKIK